MAAKKRVASKSEYKGNRGKQHPVRAASLIDIADKLKEHANNPQVDMNTPQALLRIIADVFANEGKSVQKILR